jgi:hypothetical protein
MTIEKTINGEGKMTIDVEKKKNTKNIYYINGQRVDSRNVKNVTRGIFSNGDKLRAALMVYFVEKNPELTLAQIDSRVCYYLNGCAQ